MNSNQKFIFISNVIIISCDVIANLLKFNVEFLHIKKYCRFENKSLVRVLNVLRWTYNFGSH